MTMRTAKHLIMQQKFKLKMVQQDQLALLNHYLKQHKEIKAAKADLNFSLKNIENNAIVGAARLIAIKQDNLINQNLFWLRGVFINPELRHQGLGTKLMQQCHEQLFNYLRANSDSNSPNKATIYAFPHGHLGQFYQNLNYEFIDSQALPEELKAKYQRAQNNNKDWLCMCHHL